MARSRNIKHGLYLNEDMAELSIYARYLFPCLWCLADKDGRIEYRPKKIKAEAYPYDDAVNIPGLLMELHEKQFIFVYGNGTRAYIQVNNWQKHQTPHPKEKASNIPSIDDPLSIVATIGFNEGQEKQFIFTAKPRPDREIIPDVRIPDVRIPDVRIPDVRIPDSLLLISDQGKTDNDDAKKLSPLQVKDLYLKRAGLLQLSGGQISLMTEIAEKYPSGVINEAFTAAAGNPDVTKAGFLNWAMRRMANRGDPESRLSDDDFIDELTAKHKGAADAG